MSKKLPDHIDGLVRYISSPEEKANEDLVLTYFRKSFGENFTRQSAAGGSDGHLPGHFVLELKGKTNDWLEGLFQGVAYRKNLNFNLVIVVAKAFLAAWSTDDIDDSLMREIFRENGAPNIVGKRLSKKHRSKKNEILRKALYQLPAEFLGGLFQSQNALILKEIKAFESIVLKKQKVRQKINTKNFTAILKEMKQYFDPEQPIKAVRAFYSMIYGPWDETSSVQLNLRKDDCVTIGGVEITNLIPAERLKFKSYVESHYVRLDEGENIDDFFSKYDEAIDVVDRNFRVRNGIYFTDLNLSKLAMWYVKQQVPSLGKNYLVIDPACGSGNLVTNWRSPLELRHKVVSEIEPELLFAVEQRMKGDQWHNGKFTVVPKISENKGLNFLDKSAEEYLEILKEYLSEKGQPADKPLAFLCNPPYRSDDDQKSTKVNYKVDAEILKSISKDAASDRYLCFLAQMKLICDRAADSGLPENSLLLLFTQTSWLTKRPVVLPTRRLILGSFRDKGAFIVNGAEFFDVKGKFPIAFSMWEYSGQKASLDPERPVPVLDLTHLKKNDLESLPWTNSEKLNIAIRDLTKGASKQWLGVDRQSLSGKWAGVSRRNLYRNLSKDEKKVTSITHLGLPKGDRRHKMKTTHGYSKGTEIGFLLDKTPCRTHLRPNEISKPWIHVDSRFMMAGTARIMSGIPDRGYCATDVEVSFKLFLWFAVARSFFANGYPMWANMLEMWVPNIDEKDFPKIRQMVFALAFSDNECIETSFPKDNPIKGSPSIVNQNPMSPLSNTSFWSVNLKGYFEESNVDKESLDLVLAVKSLFREWKTRFKMNKNLIAPYATPYFIESNRLSMGAGLIQIKDYAEQTDDAKLKSLLSIVSEKSSILKKSFHQYLTSENGARYFEIPNASKQRVHDITQENKQHRNFNDIVALRMALASKIIFDMNDSEEFGRVKFAKAFYLADMTTKIDLKTDYVREAAGPLDQRLLYNEKIGIEAVAAKEELFKAEKKKGKNFDFVRYKVGKRIKERISVFEDLFEGETARIDRIIRLVEPMTLSQIEIVATLYACWNDLLLGQKQASDAALINEFRDNWHPEKSRKFHARGKSRPIFTEEKLKRAIAWMKENDLIPRGEGKKTKRKPTKEDVIPF